MKYIDIHCHLDFPEYYKQDGAEIGEVLKRMKEQEIGAITIGTDLESSKRAVAIAEANENIWACIGVHPNHNPLNPPYIKGERETDSPDELFNTEEFEKLIKSPKVVAIGECGLDFFRIKKDKLEQEKDKQSKLFEQQIEFAIKYDKPLMLHCREAYDEVLEILEKYKKEAGEKLRGNCHFFAGSPEQARRFVELNFSCSFTGVITFTHDYDEVIKSLPIESIMSETDSPFVAPVPHRGKRNEPAFVVEVVKKMAEIKDLKETELSKILVDNAKRVFNI